MNYIQVVCLPVDSHWSLTRGISAFSRQDGRRLI